MAAEETDTVVMMQSLTDFLLDRAELGWFPDWALRWGIRRLCRERLKEEARNYLDPSAALRRFIREMERSPVAPVPDMANRQHYEVPSEFFEWVLGPHRKYSCCHWESGVSSLQRAEESSLELTCRRAGLKDGMKILELGCGWGSLTLWMAENLPASLITAVSNSSSQREFIQGEATRRGLTNLTVITADMNEFQAPDRYHRVVSVEMFEHMRNYRLLLKRIASWLLPGGRLFVHVFCHREFSYEFVDRQVNDWMGRYFFTGGIMPSDGLLECFQDDLDLLERWRWSGSHYEKTAEAWLENLTQNREKVIPILARTYGQTDAFRWWIRWRIFFMSCAELFGFEGGRQWWVAQYLFGAKAAAR